MSVWAVAACSRGPCWRRAGSRPDCAVIGVEPEAGNDGQQSLRKGEVVTIPVPHTHRRWRDDAFNLGARTFPPSSASGCMTSSPSATRRWFAAGCASSPKRMKLIVEPTGCLAAAAAFAAADEIAGMRVGVIISGGNVDLARFSALTEAP